MMRQIVTLCYLTSSIILLSCNITTENANAVRDTDSLLTNKSISFGDFKKIEGVDDVNKVPFDLMTKLDSIQLFVDPNHTAASLKIINDKFNNYYGFEELDDFYAIRFSVGNVLANTVEAFVLKSEFEKRSELTLEGIDLDQIRYSIYKSKSDDVNKSFSKFGNISEISVQEYNRAKSNNKAEKIIKNEDIILNDNFWGLKTNSIFQLQKIEDIEGGSVSYEYLGKSNSLNREIFLEKTDFSSDVYYTFYNTSNGERTLFTQGFPHVLEEGNHVFSWANSSDVGCVLSIINVPNNQEKQDLVFINFTNFKISNDREVILVNKNTVYVEVVPTNSQVIHGEQNKSYIKISFKNDLF